MRLRRKPKKSYRDHIINDDDEGNETSEETQEAIPETKDDSSDAFDGEALNAEPSEDDHEEEGDATEASEGEDEAPAGDEDDSDASEVDTKGNRKDYTLISAYTPGVLSRKSRTRSVRKALFGPEYEGIKLIYDMEDRFEKYLTLPPRWSQENPDVGVCPSPWIPENFEAEQMENALRWYATYRKSTQEPQRSRLMSPEIAQRLMPGPDGDLAVLMGPHKRQKEFRMTPGQPWTQSPSGLPVDDPDVEDKTPRGWMFDAGGIVTALAWSPTSTSTKGPAATQLLAVATIPFSDHGPPKAREEKTEDESSLDDVVASIQLWQMTGVREKGKLAMPSTSLPRLVGVKCFDWGRPKRLLFCPTPLLPSVSRGLLAVLCGDGAVRVLDVAPLSGSETSYEWMENPVATLGDTQEYKSAATCVAWININRIVIGHRDGCLTLWSIYPQRLLQRIPVVNTHIVELCTGYPSKPSLLVVMPVAGSLTLVDLSQPSSEYTYYPVASVNLQPYMISWSEILQGFAGLHPPHHTTMGFMHHRIFYQGRAMVTTPSHMSCISVGHMHPYVLIGCLDGSLVCCNLMQALFREKKEPTRPRIRVFENEFRPLDDRRQHQHADGDAEGMGEVEAKAERPIRGAVRILQNFMPEKNEDPRNLLRIETLKKANKAHEKKPRAKAKPKKTKAKKGAPAEAEENGMEDVTMEEAGDADGARDAADSQPKPRRPLEPLEHRLVIHEPLTRITCVVWNPNLEFSCWAACSMGSGLVRIMDLGVE